MSPANRGRHDFYGGFLKRAHYIDWSQSAQLEQRNWSADILSAVREHPARLSLVNKGSPAGCRGTAGKMPALHP
jgi:hypothetical protein